MDLSHYENIYFIGDLHGQFDALLYLHRCLRITEKDAVVSVGDLIDRGSRNTDCLNYFLETPNAYAVRGNHEDFMIRSVVFNDYTAEGMWLYNGGGWKNEIPKAYMKSLAYRALSKIPIYMDIVHNGTTFGVCHAECPLEDWNLFKKRSEKDSKLLSQCMWNRDKVYGEALTISGVDYTIHGHTPDQDVRLLGNQYWIDTGAQALKNPTANENYGLSCLQWDGETLTPHKVVFDRYLGRLDLR